MNKIRKAVICALAFASLSRLANAETLSGIYNTGPSTLEESAGSSLNIRFHPCANDMSLSCATVLDVVEPNGPSGVTELPDGRPIIGTVIVSELKPKGKGKYRSGKILAVDESVVEGKVNWYGLRVDNNFDGTLTAKGCLGFICPREMTWRQVEIAGAAAEASEDQ